MENLVVVLIPDCRNWSSSRRICMTNAFPAAILMIEREGVMGEVIVCCVVMEVGNGISMNLYINGRVAIEMEAISRGMMDSVMDCWSDGVIEMVMLGFLLAPFRHLGSMLLQLRLRGAMGGST